MKKGFFSLVLVIAGLICPAMCVVMKVQFKQDCSGYLKQAADDNSVELCQQRLDKAIAYVETHGLTEGYTSVLWKTEADNVGFWYENLKACQNELKQVVNSSPLEKTNVLMKVRETLTDEDKDGTTLTIPNGITRYPNNTLCGILNWISVVLILIGIHRHVDLDDWCI